MKEIKKIFARALRKESTKAEKVVWELLRHRKFFGLKFRRQFVVEGFVLDFYCHEIRLGIELDGDIHLKQKEYDALRQEIVESKGITIFRFNNKDILYKQKPFLNMLQTRIAHLSTPLPLGEGERLKGS